MLINLLRFGKLQTILILLLILGIIVLAIVSSTQPQESNTNPTPSGDAVSDRENPKKYAGPLQITTYTPTEDTPLLPGEVAQFLFQFSSPIEEQDLFINITQNNLSNNTTTIEFTSELDVSKTSLLIKTLPIEPASEYTIQIVYEGTKIFEIGYISDRETPNAAPSNNFDLIPYLPYETSTYSLAFFPETNKYNFSFKYDPNSSESTQEQFERAKREATAFIESKGVGINSIVIDWKYR